MTKIFLPALLFVLAYFALGSAIALEVHQHDSNTHDSSHELSLNNGKKWETDEPLRTGMENIRALVEKHANTTKTKVTTNAEYDALAKGVQNEVNYIFRNCRLDKDADAALHHMLADMLTGVSILQGKQKSARSDGVAPIAHALDSYAKFFNHPGWVTVKLD